MHPPTMIENRELPDQNPVVLEPMTHLSQTTEIAEEPVMIIEPVQILEERGDAMLSEIDMLGGTPFDQAITMPFD